MALNFPSSPTVGQVYTDSVSGFSYEWNGTVWISFSAASSSQIKVIDDISGSFNGVTLSFALTTSGFALNIANAASLRISLGGVIQSPGIDYSVSGTNIVFTTAPESGLSFSGISLGPAIPLTIIPEGTATVGSFIVSTGLSATNLYVAGVSTFVGLATHTGTIFGNNISLTGIVTAVGFVGTASTASFATTSFGLSGTPNITVGIVTASSLNVGTAVTVNSTGINVSGIVTATSFVGGGSGLTGTGSTVFNDIATNQEFFPLFTEITTGTITASGISTSKLTYNPSTGTLTVVDINSTSDINLKENIKTVENSLNTLTQLRGVSFDWKETGKSSYGVIAQELEEILPDLVKNGEVKSVNYNGLIGVLIEAVKELKAEVEELKSYK